jgi:hemerythrin-like domain-containing protein
MNLSEALTREHEEIDAGIETFVAGIEGGAVDPEPVRRTIDALRRHIYLEEQFVFPPIRQAGVLMPVLVMLREHGTLWKLMDDLIELLNDDNRPDVVDALATTCRELLTQLDQHNSKEEPLIYPHADSDLTEEATAALNEFLANGATPDGWVCEAAR